MPIEISQMKNAGPLTRPAFFIFWKEAKLGLAVSRTGNQFVRQLCRQIRAASAGPIDPEAIGAILGIVNAQEMGVDA